MCNHSGNKLDDSILQKNNQARLGLEILKMTQEEHQIQKHKYDLNQTQIEMIWD